MDERSYSEGDPSSVKAKLIEVTLPVASVGENPLQKNLDADDMRCISGMWLTLP